MMRYTKDCLDTLIGRFGSPLYLFEETEFLNNAHCLERAMQTYYEKYRIAYSFKTNYTPYICKTVRKIGAYAEVVSGMEYELAKLIGFTDEEIIFNGPCKGEAGEQAFLNGAMVHADSLDELARLCELAKMHAERQFRIGLRVNIDVGQGFVSRFGMDEEGLSQAVQMVSAVMNLSVSGLHCHISRCRSKAAWKQRMETMLTLADRYFDQTLAYIDLGSGMFGSMAPEFAAQFDNVPSYEDYAGVTAALMAEHYRGQDGPWLITEPGTTLVSRFVECISRVQAIKTVRGHSFAILDTGIHMLGETCTLKQLPVHFVPCGNLQHQFDAIDMTGYTCLEQDVMYKSFSGKLAVGDYVVFGNVGGYSNVLKPPFIQPNCAMVAHAENGEYVLMKRVETGDDLLRTYVF